MFDQLRTVNEGFKGDAHEEEMTSSLVVLVGSLKRGERSVMDLTRKEAERKRTNEKDVIEVGGLLEVPMAVEDGTKGVLVSDDVEDGSALLELVMNVETVLVPKEADVGMFLQERESSSA